MKYIKSISLLLFCLSYINGWAQTASISADKPQGCASPSHEAKFTATSSTAITSYAWSTSDGQSSVLSSPTFFWSIPGTYTVSLKINGSTTASTFTVTVFKSPIANFTPSDTTVCVGTLVSFTNSTILGDAPISTWQWDFGDGNSSSSQNPSNSYSNLGSNNVTLTATDQNGCVGKKTNISIDVTAAPTVAITNSPTNLISCTSPFNVDFNSTVAGGTIPYTYTWDFGNSQTSNQANPASVSYTTFQNYPVSLTVTDGNGCVVVNSKTVSLAQFVSDIKVVGKDTICKGGTVVFQDQSTATANNWNWTFGNGNVSSVKNPPTQTYPTPGQYWVYLISKNAQQCSSKDSVLITVLDDDDFDFKADTTKGCQAPFPVTFNVDTVETGATYAWNFGAAGTGTGSPVTHNFPEGTFNVSCTITNKYGCKTTVTKPSYIMVDVPNADFIADTLKGCKPLSVDFTNQSEVGYNGNSGSTATYSWIFENVAGGTTGSTDANPVNVLYPDSGEFDVTLIIKNNLGCVDTTVKTSYIQPGLLPIPDFVADPLIGCHPLQVQFTDSSSDWVDEWQWDFGGPGTSTEENPSFTYDTWHPSGPNDTGYFDITLIVGHHECYDTLIVDSLIYVKGPSPRFHIYNNGVKDDNIVCNYDNHLFLFRDTSLTQRSTSTYYWDFGDPTSGSANFSSNKDTVTHFYANPGQYTVELKIYDSATGCTDSVERNVIVSDFYAQIQTQQKVCVEIETMPFTGLFTDSANNNGATIVGNTWQWNYGDGSANVTTISPLLSNVTHVYNNPNDSTIVTLIATNSVGCIDTVLTYIRAKALPDANFTLAPASGCAPVIVDFTDISSTPATNGNITTWTWTLGNGTTVYNQNPQDIVYTGTGVKTVTLVVTDAVGCVSDPKTSTVTVYDPNAALLANDADTTICSGSQITFATTGSTPVGGLEYAWNYGDGTTTTPFSSTNTGAHTYTVNITDTFDVWMYVKDAQGCLDSAMVPVKISKPYAEFFIDNPIADCAPITFQLENTNSSNDVTTVTYNFGDGTSLNNQTYSDSISHTWQNPGLYDISYIVTNGKGCTDTLVRNDYVSVGGPVATFDYYPKSGCPPFTVTFTTSNVDNVSSYQFLFGDGSDTTILVNSTPVTLTHTYYNSNNYLPAIKIKDTLNTLIGDIVYCPRTIIGDSVLQIKGPIVGFTVDTTFQCAMGAPFNFIDTTISNNSTTTGILWEFGDGLTQSLTAQDDTVPHGYNDVGYFDVSLTYYSAPNCTSKVTKPAYVSVFEGPDINLDIEGAGCPPYGKQFYADTAAAGASGIYAQSIHWDFGDGDTSNIEDPFHTYQTSGNYTPGLTIDFSNGCEYTYQSSGSIVVYEEPVAGFLSDPVFDEFDMVGYNFIDSSLNAVTWSWSFGDTEISTEQNPQHLYITEGDYEVQLYVTNQFGCMDTIIQVINFKRDVYIPNILSLDGDENNQVFNVRLPEQKECMKLWVYDRWGVLRFENLNYKNDWKGVDKSGKRLPVDTYYYILNFCDKLTYNGWVYIHYNEK